MWSLEAVYSSIPKQFDPQTPSSNIFKFKFKFKIGININNRSLINFKVRSRIFLVNDGEKGMSLIC